MAGHVFIVHGDLTRISCDAWLMPCGVEGSASHHWWAELAARHTLVPVRFPQGWGHDGVRCVRLFPSPVTDEHGDRIPAPWLVNIGGGPERAVSWFVEGVRQFMAEVSVSPEVREPRHGRARALVALPIVGTGWGGARARTGAMVRALLPCLYESAREHDVDIALVIKHRADYAAAQRERLRYYQRGLSRWPELTPALRERADRLANLASDDRLVLFLGAGVSVGAGVPTWGRFLEQLARDPAQRLRLDLRELRRWSYADQARIIERGFGGRAPMERAITRHMQRHHYSLTHAFLAALPSREIITTNYDTLFELASSSIGREAAVLPYENATARERWILKMHGCVNHPGDIVLTREDFLRYAERRSALAGIVQALLITSHMLFVGFSLDDDNFQRIADDVRKIMDRAHGQRGAFGTSMVLLDRPFLSELWHEEVELVTLRTFDPERPRKVQLAEAARRLEIFLDYMLAQVADPTYLLDERFVHILDRDERELRDLLLEMLERATPEMRQTAAWSRIASLYEELGHALPRVWLIAGTSRTRDARGQDGGSPRVSGEFDVMTRGDAATSSSPGASVSEAPTSSAPPPLPDPPSPPRVEEEATPAPAPPPDASDEGI